MATTKTKDKEKKKDKRDKKFVKQPVYSDLEINGTVYKTTYPPRFQPRKWKPKDIGEIESLITGVVKTVFVKKGDAVKKGDCLLLLEAMKMHNEILSPVDGIVREVFVTKNTNVPKGTLMVKIVP